MAWESGFDFKELHMDMGMQPENTAWACSPKIQHGHAAKTCRKDMLYGHAAWACSMGMKHGQEAWT